MHSPPQTSRQQIRELSLTEQTLEPSNGMLSLLRRGQPRGITTAVGPTNTSSCPRGHCAGNHLDVAHELASLMMVLIQQCSGKPTQRSTTVLLPKLFITEGILNYQIRYVQTSHSGTLKSAFTYRRR